MNGHQSFDEKQPPQHMNLLNCLHLKAKLPTIRINS
jgi:hypothetical protein